MLLLLTVTALGVGYAFWPKDDKTGSNELEDKRKSLSLSGIVANARQRFYDLLPGTQQAELDNVYIIAIGAPYVWAGPSFDTVKAGDLQSGALEGMDCSGFVLTALRYLGIVNEQFCYNRGTTDMANASDKVELANVRPGDFCYYGGHVTLVYDIVDGVPMVLSMSGGDHTTTSIAIAEKIGAKCKLLPYNYKSYVCFCRPKKEYLLNA